jgi:hypothetical protein
MTLQSTSTSLDLTTDENISLAQLRNQLLQQQQPLTISPQQNDNQNTQNAQNLITNSQTTTSQFNQPSLVNPVVNPLTNQRTPQFFSNPSFTQPRDEVPLSILLKFISPYSGDTATLQTFIRNCQNAFDLASFNQHHILFAYICSQLRDKAELAVNNHNLSTWPQLKKFLIDTYSDKKHYGHLLLELQSRKQFNNESVTEFTQRIETCTTRLLQSARSMSEDDSEIKGRFATIDQIALQTFIIGVKSEISVILRSRG